MVSIADEKKLEKLSKEKELAQEWEKKAMLAVKAGNDELVKKALARKSMPKWPGRLKHLAPTKSPSRKT